MVSQIDCCVVFVLSTDKTLRSTHIYLLELPVRPTRILVIEYHTPVLYTRSTASNSAKCGERS